MTGPTGGGVGELAPTRAAELVEAGAFLLDVREPDEWERGHAPAAAHIPLGELAERMGQIPVEGEVVVVCHLGGRSLAAANALARAGYRVHNLAGGMRAWQEAGLAVVTDTGLPGEAT